MSRSDPTGELPTVRPAPAPPSARPHRRHRGRIAVAAVVAVAAIAAAYVWAGRGTPEAAPDASPGSQTSATAAPPGATDQSPAPSTAEVKAQMDAFITSYLATVTSDPQAAFDRLTPEFQRTSGDYEGYVSWWNRVRSAELTSITSNPSDETVDYTVDYRMRTGRSITQRIRLQLRRQGDTYLIAGEA